MTPIKQQDLIDRGFIQTDFTYSGDFTKEKKDSEITKIVIDYEYVNIIDDVRDIKIYDWNGDYISFYASDMSLEDLDHLIRILKL